MYGGRHLLTLISLTFVHASLMFYTMQHCGEIGRRKTAFMCL